MKITSYELLGKLPDPFVFDDGRRVQSVSDWETRRGEIYKTAVELQFGRLPPAPEFLDVEPLYTPGRADAEYQWRIVTGTRARPVRFTLYVHIPGEMGKYPVALDGDLCYAHLRDRALTKKFSDKGILLASFNRCEIVPDLGSDPSRPMRTGPLFDAYPAYDFGVIGAWAWGYFRALDALEKLGLVDPKCVAFTGLSRGGKAALLAGACDERATIVNPEATCAGGASCYRVHMTGVNEDGSEARSERLKDIVNAFPDWFGPRLKDYQDDEAALPFDEHYLKALVAPRVFFDSQALSDMWAGPVCTYQTSVAAREVWKLYGKIENVKWYWRSGGHDHTYEDYDMLINLMEHEIRGAALSEKFMKLPFDPPAPAHDWSCDING